MLYEMVFIHEGEVNPGREVLLKAPNISKYLDDFGIRRSDIGFVAESEIGANLLPPPDLCTRRYSKG